MNCPKCSTQERPVEMILTRATNHGDDYYFCRICKKELAEIQAAMAASERLIEDGHAGRHLTEEERQRIAVGATARHSSRPRGYVPGTPQTLAVKRKLQSDDDFVDHVHSVVRVGQELFAKDPTSQEACRSIDGVPVHFWHRARPGKDFICTCGTYRRPGKLASDPGIDANPAQGLDVSGLDSDVALRSRCVTVTLPVGAPAGTVFKIKNDDADEG